MPKPFVELFIDFTKEAESPESFFRWAAYATIAATLKDKVWLQLPGVQVWPNIYVILMARSAAMRKSRPLREAQKLLRDVQATRIIFGRSSIQAVVKELGQGESDAKTGAPKLSATGILLSEELSSFSPDDPATIPILTDLYDNHAEWTNSLVGQGKVTLKNTCITLLAASNEPLFRQVYNSLAIRGGLLGRTFIIREHQKRSVNSLMYPEIEDTDEWLAKADKMKDNSELKNSLMAIGNLSGRVIMDYPARVEFDTWYKGINNQIEQHNMGSDSGVVERIHAGVWKISMIIALSSTYEKVIRKIHVEEALTHCMSMLKNYEVLTMGTGKSATAEPLQILLAWLFERGGKATLKDILKHNWQHFDSPTLNDSMIPTLVTGGLVIERSIEGVPSLELTETAMNHFKGALKK